VHTICRIRKHVTTSLQCRCLLAVLCLFALFTHPTAAQEDALASFQADSEQDVSGTKGQVVKSKTISQSASSEATAQLQVQPNEKENKPEGPGSFVAAPIPTSSAAIGTGVVLMAGYIFPFSKTDRVSPPSVIGVAGLFTSNGTRGFALVGQFYLKENTRNDSGIMLGSFDSIQCWEPDVEGNQIRFQYFSFPNSFQESATSQMTFTSGA
jgi:hypothetical protein